MYRFISIMDASLTSCLRHYTDKTYTNDLKPTMMNVRYRQLIALRNICFLFTFIWLFQADMIKINTNNVEIWKRKFLFCPFLQQKDQMNLFYLYNIPIIIKLLEILNITMTLRYDIEIKL